MRHIPVFLSSAIILLLVLSLHALGWAAFNRPQAQPFFGGQIVGLAFNPFPTGTDPTAWRFPTRQQLAQDVDTVAPHVRSLRTYSSLNGLDAVAPLAAPYNIEVTLGMWLSRDKEANKAEIDAGIRAAKNNRNIKRVMVGNEVLLREDMSPADLIAAVRLASAQLAIPVSTAEPWHIWLKYPELADAVDFITVHLLPYWEGVDIAGALPYLEMRYNELQQRYPNKHIVIGEVGWPSDGPWVEASEPSLVNEAQFIRGFLAKAAEKRWDYYLMEAFDQPWKRTLEGSVGASWGLWDENRTPKFAMSGDVRERQSWWGAMLVASGLALPLMIYFLRRSGHVSWLGRFFYCGIIQTIAALLVLAVLALLQEATSSWAHLPWILLMLAQLVLLSVLLTDGLEFTEMVFAKQRLRAFTPFNLPAPPDAPKVSIHVPCYNEPPEMVIATLDALAQLAYPNFEVLVIDNNTRDAAVWQPLEEHCTQLGERFRFFHLPKWPGYKAGALNFGLSQTAPDAEFVAVIDSDYQVQPDWLASTIPFFAKPEIAIVQGPQDYRDWQNDRFKTMIYWEYAGFFHIGMVQRNDRNAIIQHGTMTIIRKSALLAAPGWAEWCICEDAELGLRLFAQGHEAVYLEHSMGRGLVPDNFAAYKTQRFRWAYGAMQIMKRHAQALLPGGKSLTHGQRFHFFAGWLPWLADAAHFIFALAAIFWTMLLLLGWVEFPPLAFLVPSLAAFSFKVLASFWLYKKQVKCTLSERIGAAIAGMSLTHTVGRAMLQGLFTNGKPFFRTPKNENAPALIQGLLMAWEEILLLLLLWCGGIATILVYGTANQEAMLWASLMLVQALPYLSALITSCINAIPTLHQKNNHAA